MRNLKRCSKKILKNIFALTILITGVFVYADSTEKKENSILIHQSLDQIKNLFSKQKIFEISAEKGFMDLTENNLNITNKNIKIKKDDGGQYFLFNGKDSFIKIEKSPILNLSHNFGIEAEIKLNSKQSKVYQRLFSHCLFNPRGGYDVAIHNGKLKYWNAEKKGWINSSLSVANGQWHKIRIIITKDQIFFNVNENSSKANCQPNMPSKVVSVIGALSADCRQGHLSGKLKNLKVFKLIAKRKSLK